MPLAKRRLDSSINVSSLETRFDVNPFYEKNRRDFNEAALKDLLINTLEVKSRSFRLEVT